MINNHKAIALIPARGGSKGVLKKNIRLVNGLPLLDYTLKAALDSNYIDQVYLSSDDNEVLSRGKIYNVYTVKRPLHLATDTSTAVDLVNHFLTDICKNKLDNDMFIIYLQPTSPLRTSHHIDNAIQSMVEVGCSALVSVTELDKSPYKSFKLNTDGLMESLFDEKLSNLGRQQLPKTYIPNGAIYIFKVSDFLSRKGFPSNGSFPYIMDKVSSVDIDAEADLEYVDKYLREIHG